MNIVCLYLKNNGILGTSGCAYVEPAYAGAEPLEIQFSNIDMFALEYYGEIPKFNTPEKAMEYAQQY